MSFTPQKVARLFFVEGVVGTLATVLVAAIAVTWKFGASHVDHITTQPVAIATQLSAGYGFGIIRGLMASTRLSAWLQIVGTAVLSACIGLLILLPLVLYYGLEAAMPTVIYVSVIIGANEVFRRAVDRKILRLSDIDA